MENNDTDIMGVIIFSIIQYEEDSIIEKYDQLYDFSKFNYKNFMKELTEKNKSSSPNVFNIIENGKIVRNRKHNNYIEIKNKEILYNYTYRGKQNIICHSEWNGNNIATKYSVTNDNPYSEKLVKCFEKENLTKIIKYGRMVNTLNGSPVICFYDDSWKIL